MNKNNELDQRLAKADPSLKRTPPKLSDSTISAAIAGDGKLSLKARYQLLGQNIRRLSLGVAVGGSAAAVAVAMVVSSSSQPLIQLSANQSSANPESSISADLAGGKMMMPYMNYEYVAGPGLPSNSGSGQVFKLVRQSTPAEVLKKVAAVFGVEGTVNKYPDFSETNQGYFFGQSEDPWGYDGKNPVISLWWSGTASWNYSNPASMPESVCEKTDADGNCTSWPEFVPTPELLPTKSEAIAKALEVFNSTGLMVRAEEIRIDASEWGVSASASMTVGGQSTNVEWYLGWSSNGELSYAGGHSVASESMGTYGTISAVSAVDRLSDWRWSGSPSSAYYQRYQPAIIDSVPYEKTDESTTTDSTSTRSEGEAEPGSEGEAEPGSEGEAEPGSEGEAEPGSEGEAAPGAGDSSPGDDLMPMPEPEPETVTITVIQAERALLSIWDASGDVWLVPGWILINDQGWFGSVISVIEGVIELPKETEFDIMPMPDEDSGVSNK
jgi:hypothetical protein